MPLILVHTTVYTNVPTRRNHPLRGQMHALECGMMSRCALSGCGAPRRGTGSVQKGWVVRRMKDYWPGCGKEVTDDDVQN